MHNTLFYNSLQLEPKNLFLKKDTLNYIQIIITIINLHNKSYPNIKVLKYSLLNNMNIKFILMNSSIDKGFKFDYKVSLKLKIKFVRGIKLIMV
jgi:hypothetical protein